MAAHHIAIAKASLAASLLRPDPTPVPRDEITRFHALLESALTQCSPPNVQACTKWLLGNITPSSGRIKTLGKYLTALSASFVTLDGGRSGAQAQALPKEKTRSKRRGLHILYVVNDLLHATKYHGTAPYAHTSLTSNLQPHLMDLVGSAASCELSNNGKIHQRIAELLDHWERKGYYVQEYCKKMHIAASASRAAPHGSSSTEAGGQGAAAPSGNTASKGKDAPFVMPATHGDRSIPWYDLPAGNMMPHMVPNSPIPINTRIMQPLQFTAGPADEKLVSAVKDLLKEVESIYDSTHQLDEGIVADIDEMGQPMILDADSGELVPGNGYYGWSRTFCERMRRRMREGPTGNDGGRGRSRSGSRSRSSSPRKRRRYSSSISSRSRSGTRHRSGDQSRSRSPSMPASGRSYRRNGDTRSRSPSRARSLSRSNPPQRPYRSLRSRSKSRSRDRSSPRHISFSNTPVGPSGGQQLPPGPPVPPMTQTFPHGSPPAFPPLPQLPFPNQFGQGFPVMAVPPPPPPNYNGQWPPPPPPPPPSMGSMPNMAQMFQQAANFAQFQQFPGMMPQMPMPPMPPTPNASSNYPPYSGGAQSSSPVDAPSGPAPWGQQVGQRNQSGGGMGSSPPAWQQQRGGGYGRGRGWGRGR
ncbi:hypothetical protein LTR39_001145 [Cryomyces antarcticus]|nr:hypothetical protein LTR39_001145 [Cryomyces antarcticus]